MFSKKTLFFDAHFHYSQCLQKNIVSELMLQNIPENEINYSGISCALTNEEFLIQEKSGKNIFKAYAVHPQNAADCNIEEQRELIEGLIKQKKICAVGECGFDFYTEELKNTAEIQNNVFLMQIELAEKYNLPLIVHSRKANERLFALSDRLKNLPAVLLHSFMGNSIEAQSLLNHGIKAYFSFGKQIINGNKKVIDCVKNLPLENLLFETDAPYQFLKGEEFTSPVEIEKVYKAGFMLRENSGFDFEGFCEKIFINACTFLPDLKNM